MDFNALLKAYLISQGAHTGGHFYQAMNPNNPMRDVPMRLDAKNLVEEWEIPDKWSPPREDDPYKNLYMSYKDYLADNNRKAADIHGAGFAMQDRMRDLIDDPETKQEVAGMNALIKALYLAGVPMKLSKQIRSGGDIGGMEETSGNKYVNALLLASMLGDGHAIMNPKSQNSLQFSTLGQGAPGLVYTRRF